MSYDRHRALQEAHRIEWRGNVLQYSPDLAAQLVLAQAALRPDGPFPAITDSVRCVVGKQVMTLGRGEVEELVLLALKASVAGLEVINGVTKTEGAS
jgi:hypothetical protein